VALLCVVLAGAIAIFWDGLISLGSAWSVPEYSHGPLIPVLSFYLFLCQLRESNISKKPLKDRWLGVAVVAFGMAVGLIGDISRIPDIVTYGMLIWLYGMLLVTFGFKNGWVFWPPVLHLIYMLPLPNFIYWQVSIQLQFISSELGVWFIHLADIPVFLDGNIIDLGIYKLHVAEACSGLRYLFPVMSFSYVFAVLYRGPVWIKAVLLLSAAPITIFMNSFRIGVIGVLVDNYGIEQAEGFLHYFEGWVIFIMWIVFLFALARALQYLSGDRRPIAEALDLSYEGLWPQISRVASMRSSAALTVVAVLIVGVSAGWYLTPS
jgi:exosortase D (VPLPA-CTERM-specific)